MPIIKSGLLSGWSTEALEQLDMTVAEYAIIGRVAVESAFLENAVERHILVLSRTKGPITEILWGRAQFDGKLAILQALIEHRLNDDQTRLTPFAVLFKKIRENNTERTTAIHGIWAATTIGDLVKGLPRKPKAHRISELKKKPALDIERALTLGTAIRESRFDLFRLLRKTWPQLYALRLPGLSKYPWPSGRRRIAKSLDTKPRQK